MLLLLVLAIRGFITVTKDCLFGWAPHSERFHANTGAMLNPIFVNFVDTVLPLDSCEHICYLADVPCCSDCIYFIFFFIISYFIDDDFCASVFVLLVCLFS